MRNSDYYINLLQVVRFVDSFTRQEDFPYLHSIYYYTTIDHSMYIPTYMKWMGLISETYFIAKVWLDLSNCKNAGPNSTKIVPAI